MAGGSEWRLIRKSDSADFYQKVTAGPWFIRRRISYSIRSTVQGTNVDIGAGDIGARSGIITFIVAGALKSRSISGNGFVCQQDDFEDSGDAQVYGYRSQVWVWEDPTEEEVDFS